MTRYHAANRFQTRLAASVNESQIYFEVESASGCPEVPFKLTVGTEIVDVIGVVGNTFTVQRGAEGTTPQSHPQGALVQNRWTAGTYEDLWDGIDDHITATATDNVHGLKARGALLRLTANKSVPSGARTVIDWDSPIYDTSNFWSADNPSRLTVPQGVSKVRLTTFISWQSNNDGERTVHISIYGVTQWLGMAADRRAASGYSETTISTPVVEVIAGDYFEVIVTQNSGVTLDVLYDRGTTFSIEVIE